VGAGFRFLCSFLCLSFVISLVRVISSWDRPGRGAKGSLQRAAVARVADGVYVAMIPQVAYD